MAILQSERMKRLGRWTSAGEIVGLPKEMSDRDSEGRARPGEGGSWSNNPLTLQAYSQDLWPRKLLELREKGPSEPTVDLVIWPESVERVSQIVLWAKEADVALYPYGAGSGVCGATIPAEEEHRPRVLVDLKRMRKVREIDSEAMVVHAETGIIGENLERHLNQEGYTLGHFPSSIYCSSLGGYLAARSAGQLSTKYGKIEDMVLSMEVVLPDGSIAETGRAPRSAMGPDWTQLLLGSEGTLGFFTAARLQIHPQVNQREMMGWSANSTQEALKFARALIQNGIRPAVLRIYDETETTLTQSGIEKGRVAIVTLFEEARPAIAQVELQEAQILAKGMGIHSLGPALAEHWWEHRYDVSYKQQMILSHNRTILDTFEVAATWSNLEAVYQAVKKSKIGIGVILAHFSHFYHTGANIYFTLVAHSGVKASAVESYDSIWESVMGAALGAGATLSHHHGSGSLKNEWIRKEKEKWLPIFERVKRGFDPENRFNPNKMGL